jgi:hypothetical protein
MSSVHSILDQRTKKNPAPSKMAAMARQSAAGNLTSFAGVFSVAELNETEKKQLEEILNEYAESNDSISSDLETLISLTSEVKAITNQAAILHGERIKKAHTILTRYRDGAFTAWLLAAYGNRQTPYNLMQYYEFYEVMPKKLRPQIEAMPRQAVYVLATRTGSIAEKQNIVENYQGQTKAEVLTLIRQTFPLDTSDRRQAKVGPGIIQSLQKVNGQVQSASNKLSRSEKEQIRGLLKQILQFLG